LPSWSLSSLSNSLRLVDEEEAEPPDAELGLVVDEEEEGDDEDGEVDELLPCAMEGDDEEPELLFESPAA
jgi:hypothetical protein